LVQSVLHFLIRSGMTSAEISSVLTECQHKQGSTRELMPRSSREAHRVGNGNVSAEVMRIWHRDAKFIDREASPRPLQLNRGSNSLVALVRRLDPEGNPMSSIGVMRAVGLIRRLPDGRYVPTAESVKIDHLHPLAIEHIAKSVVRLVSTVCRNTDPSREAIPLVERYAYAPDMSKDEAESFAEFTRNQGMAYLEAVDDWLEQRRIIRKAPSVRRRKGASVAAGVHLFAYIDDYGSAMSRERLSGPRIKPLSSGRSSNSHKTRTTSSRAARA
jgi:hypothetical protein